MREEVRKGYEAGDYEGDYRNSRSVRPHEKQLFEEMISEMDGEKVLDLGCGTGEPFDRFLVDQGLDVTGVDLVEKHIHSAREHVPEASFVQGDFFDVDPEDEKFDAVVSFYAVFHLPREEHEELFQHINSLLKDNGLMLVTVAGGEMEKHVEHDWAGSEMIWSSYSQEKNKEIIRDSGFDILDTYEEQSEDEHHLWILARKK